MNLPNKVIAAGVQRASRLPAGILTRNVLDYAKDRPRDVQPAAMRGIEAAKSWRAQISSEMNTNQIAEAQRQARAWLAATGYQRRAA